MLLQVNIHFKDSKDKERIASAICKNGKELQDAVNQDSSNKGKQAFLDNVFAKVFAVDAEMIKVPPESQTKFYEVLYHIACSKGFTIIAIVMADRIGKNINQYDGNKLVESYCKAENNAQQTQSSELKRVALPNSKADYERQQNFVKQIDRRGEVFEGDQVYGISINDVAQGLLYKINKVRILSNCTQFYYLVNIQLVTMFEVYLQWTNIEEIKQNTLKDRPEIREIRVKCSNIESKNLEKAKRFEASFDLQILDDIASTAIFVINNHKIVYEFPFKYQK